MGRDASRYPWTASRRRSREVSSGPEVSEAEGDGIEGADADRIVVLGSRNQHKPKVRHSALGYLNPNEFERRAAAPARQAHSDAPGRNRTGLGPCQIGRLEIQNNPLWGPSTPVSERDLLRGLYRIVPKSTQDEVIDVSHLEGKTIDGLARMLPAPVAMVRTSRPPWKK